MRIRTGGRAKTVIAVHDHGYRARRERNIGEDLRRLTGRGGIGGWHAWHLLVRRKIPVVVSIAPNA